MFEWVPRDVPGGAAVRTVNCCFPAVVRNVGKECNVLLNSEWDLEEDIEAPSMRRKNPDNWRCVPQECGVKENMQVLDRVGFASEASVSTCASLDLERWQHFAPLSPQLHFIWSAVIHVVM